MISDEDVVGKEALERAVAEDVVGDLLVMRSRSSRESVVSPARCRRMSTTTRSRSAAGSIETLYNWGPSSPITVRWTRFLSSANGSRAP